MKESLRSIFKAGRIYFPEDLSAAEFQDRSTDRTGLPGNACAIALPGTEQEVEELLHFARQHALALVPSAGRTGLSGGAVAVEGAVVVTLERMNKLVELDEVRRTITVEAGMTLAQLQEYAASKGLIFPVDFAASGSAQVGGAIATNAGGIHFLRYGGMRRNVVGLRCLTGSSQWLDFSSEPQKNNTGYELRELIPGSEGTLAIITQATLRLAPAPRDLQVALAGFQNFAEICALSELLLRLPLNALECFEKNSLDSVCQHLHLPLPFSTRHEWYLLVEFEQATGNAVLEALASCEHCQIADSSRSRQAFWKYRESISESIHNNLLYKSDLSLPARQMTAFVDAACSMAKDCGLLLAIFGHAGDGNLHVNIIGNKMAPEEQALANSLMEKILLQVQFMGGSISAEHGIGLLKKKFLKLARSQTEIEIMRAIKKAWDPDLILNPGKIFSMSD